MRWLWIVLLMTGTGPLIAPGGWAADEIVSHDRLDDGDRRTAEDLERTIEHGLDTLQSGILVPGSRVQILETRRDLSVTGQRLDTLKTVTPHAPSIPLLERQLDRVERAPQVGRGSALGRDPIPATGRPTSAGRF